MSQEMERLQLLSTFHYVLGAMAALFACIPVIHLVLGLAMVLSPESFCSGTCTDAPPQWLGWLFTGIGGTLILLGWTYAAMLVIAGRYLANHRHYRFCFAVAVISCAFVPFGTILGIFTLTALTTPVVKEHFVTLR